MKCTYLIFLKPNWITITKISRTEWSTYFISYFEAFQLYQKTKLAPPKNMILRGTEENKQNNVKWSPSYQAFLPSLLCLRHHLWVVLTLSFCSSWPNFTSCTIFRPSFYTDCIYTIPSNFLTKLPLFSETLILFSYQFVPLKLSFLELPSQSGFNKQNRCRGNWALLRAPWGAGQSAVL